MCSRGRRQRLCSVDLLNFHFFKILICVNNCGKISVKKQDKQQRYHYQGGCDNDKNSLGQWFPPTGSETCRSGNRLIVHSKFVFGMKISVNNSLSLYVACN